MDNVIDLNGQLLEQKKSIESAVVTKLEEMLEAAKAGKIKAIAFAAVDEKAWIQTGVVNSFVNRHYLVAGVSYLLNDLLTESNALASEETEGDEK